MPTPLLLIDTHAHLDLEHFGSDIDDLLLKNRKGVFPDSVQKEEDDLRTFEIKMEAIVIPGITASSSRNCAALTKESSFLFAAVGIHPNSAGEQNPGDWTLIEELAKEKQVVAIGETGLDRYWDRCPFATQLENFERHIDLAKRRNLPILIHSREADADLIPLLRRESVNQTGNRLRGIIHAFSSDRAIAEKCVEYGFHISFAGSVTYTNQKFAPLWNSAQFVPDERLLIETDSPYLCPHPYRSKLSRNEPIMVALTAKRLAELRGVSIEEIAESTTNNAKKLLDLNSRW